MQGSTVQLEVVCSVCKKVYSENELVRYQNDNVCYLCKDKYFQRVREGVATSDRTVMRYSSIRRRFWASALDGLIGGIVQLILTFALTGSLIAASNASDMSKIGPTMIVFVLSTLFGVSYYVFFLGWKGATPGKMMLGIKVVRPDGQAIGYGRAFLRYVGMLVSAIILMIGYIMAIFDDEKRALHDKIADTRVIYK
jgi:uncharacterized RDD family membrane protein YckC